MSGSHSWSPGRCLRSGMSLLPTRGRSSATAAGHASYPGREYHSCTSGCRDNLVTDPLTHVETADAPGCGKDVKLARPGAEAHHEGHRYLFCSVDWRAKFAGNPEMFLEARRPVAEQP